MVTRTYNAPQFRGQDQRTVQQSQVQGSGVRDTRPISVDGSAWMTNALQSLGGTAVQALNKMGEMHRANQYLEGAAQAGIIESEDELQADQTTRDWAVAGYRDTMGKLKLADAQAQFAIDIKQLREKGPEELQDYLRKRRNDMMPQLSSMSREARSSATGQMLLADRQATSTWKAEHTAFIIDQRVQSYQVPFAAALQDYTNNARKLAVGEITPEAMASSRDSLGAVMFSARMDPSLPRDVQNTVIGSMLQQSLSEDAVGMYEYLKDTELAPIDGSKGTLVSQLPQDVQLKLSNQYRDAYKRSADQRNLARTLEFAHLDVQLDKENFTYPGTLQDLRVLTDRAVVNGEMTAQRQQSLYEKFLEGSAARESGTALVSAYTSGNLRGIQGSGKSLEQATTAVRKSLDTQGATLQQRFDTWFTSGSNGMPKAYQMAGEELGVTLRAIMSDTDGQVLNQHRELFAHVQGSLTKEKSKGHTYVVADLLSGLPDDGTRVGLQRVLSELENGASVDAAFKSARATVEREQSMTPAARAALSATKYTDLVTSVNGLEPRGFFNTLALKAQFWSDTARAELAIRPESGMNSRDGWFSDTSAVQAYTRAMRESVLIEAGRVHESNPMLSADEVMQNAMGNVMGRTINTSHGPVFLPGGSSVEQITGVRGGNVAAIGDAISGMLVTSKEDSRYVVQFDNGRILASEYDRKGNELHSFYLKPEDIQTRIANDTRAEQERNSEVYGNGTLFKEKGVDFRYNGENTAGVNQEVAHRFRMNLTRNEGFLPKVVNDVGGRINPNTGKPVRTVGVGISDTNDFFPKNVLPDGSVAPADHERAFKQASNAALEVGERTQRQFNLQGNDNALLLFSEFAYQAGSGFISRKDTVGDTYRELAANIKVKNYDAALKALEESSVWRYSGETRKMHYKRLLQSAII